MFNFPFIDICSSWPNQIEVQIYEPSQLLVDVDPELILCENNVNSGIIEGFVSGGVGVVNYAWHFQGEEISTDMDLPTVNLSPGVYSLVAIDECGNISQSNIDYSIVMLIVGFSTGKPGMGWGGLTSLLLFPVVGILSWEYIW